MIDFRQSSPSLESRSLIMATTSLDAPPPLPPSAHELGTAEGTPIAGLCKDNPLSESCYPGQHYGRRGSPTAAADTAIN
jgi:hypothetical protein